VGILGRGLRHGQEAAGVTPLFLSGMTLRRP
jgi:hypothetical protein